MLSRNFKFSLLFLMTFGVGCLLAQSVAGSAEARLTASLDSLSGQRDSALARRDSLRARSEALAAEVARYKESQEKDYSTLAQYRLEAGLRRSQALADSLDSLNGIIEGCERSLASKRLAAVSRATAALDSLSRALEAVKDRKQRESLLKRIEELTAWRSGLIRYSLKPLPPPGGAGADWSLDRLSQAIRITDQDSPEQILEKADFLADMAARWSRSLTVLEANIKRLDEEKAIRTRLGEFAQELSLFDETGLSSRAGVRPEQSGERGTATPVDNGSGFSKFTTSGVLEELPALDQELSNPETQLYLLQNLEHLSLDDLEAALGRLDGQRDSIRVNLRLLQDLEREFRSRAGRSDQQQEEAPRK